MHLIPNSYGVVREHNDCHSPEDGKFCSDVGKRSRKDRGAGHGPGYKLQFRSKWPFGAKWWKLRLRDEVSLEVQRRANTAKIALTFLPWATGYLGAPTLWKAPNGVDVLYVKGQRRTTGGANVYHDFNAGSDEMVVPLTRNIGSGRRALRAWAAVHMGNKITARMQARQMVRPGD